MERFGIFAPGYAAGLKLDFPHILMDSNSICDLLNVRLEEGYAKGVHGRLSELVQEVFTCTAPPVQGCVCVNGKKDLYLINIGTAYNRPEWVGYAITIDSTDKVEGEIDTVDRLTHATLLANATASKGNVFAITAANTGTKTFSIADTDGSYAALYTAGDKVVVDNSTGNDGIYTIVSATWDTVDTTKIVVSETVADATADGVITDKGVIFSVGTSGTLAPVPDGNAILEFHTLKIADVEYVLVFTKAHAYLWSSSWSAWILKHTCSGDCVRWDVDHLHEKLYATNGVDKVLWWGTDTTALFAVLDDALNGIEYSTGVYLTAAKALCVYENYLILGYTTENGFVHRDRVRWCNYDDPATAGSWKTGDAGAADVDGAGSISGFGYYHSLLVIGKEYSAKLFWLVSGSDTFNMSVLSRSVGFLCGKSGIMDPDGEFFFLASDFSIRRIDGEDLSPPIRSFVYNINPQYKEGIRGTYYSKSRERIWSVPWGSGSTGNNRLMRLRIEGDRRIFSFDDFAVSAFGYYSRTKEWTIDTIPFDTIDEWAWDSIDSTEGSPGFMPLLAGDNAGNVFSLYAAEKDNGTLFERRFTLTTDFMQRQGLRIFKRMLELRVYVMRRDADLELYIKGDDESGWRYVGEVDCESNADIVISDLPVDERFRSCQIDVRGDFTFEVIGFEFGYEYWGDR